MKQLEELSSSRHADSLEVGRVYLVTTTDQMSFIGSYEGSHRSGTLHFVSDVRTILHVPPDDIADLERLV